MPAPTSLVSSKRLEAACRAQQQVESLVRMRMVGRKIDAVGFLEELLAIATQVGELRCDFVGEYGLRFQLGSADPFEVELDGNRSKLRMLCARLAVLCQESGHDFMLYGGEGTIDRTVKAHPTDREGDPIYYFLTWQARWKNTPGEHWFVISAR